MDAEENRTTRGGEVAITISSQATPEANVDSKTPKGSTSKATGPKLLLKESSPGEFPKSDERSKMPTTNENSDRPTRSVYSKSHAIDAGMFEDNSEALQEHIAANSSHRNSLNKGSPSNRSTSSIRTNSPTPKTPLIASPGGQSDDNDSDEEEIYKTELKMEKRRRVRAKVVIEWVTTMCILGCLVASLTNEKLRKTMIWDLELWKWCVLVMVIFCGMLIINWFLHFVVFFIERNYTLRSKVLPFVHGMKTSIRAFVWIGSVLLAWICLFNHGVDRPKTAANILHLVTLTLISLLGGSFLWLLKTLSLTILATKFQVKAFFDRIQESIFHQYLLQTLSGPPVMEEVMMARLRFRSSKKGQLSFRSNKKSQGSKDKTTTDMGKVLRMNQKKISAWTMKLLVDTVTSSGLSIVSNTLDESVEDGHSEQTDREINSEWEAKAAAFHIFKNVAQPGCKYIDKEDVARFMIKEEIDLFFPLIDGYTSGQIHRKAMKDWVVNAYHERKALAHTLNDTKMVIQQLNKLMSGILVVVTIIIWLLVMKITAAETLAIFLTAAAFAFGNTIKTIFEAAIFIFAVHPFDVGDRCVVDGVPLLVEEIDILTTVFLKLDNEKIYYPNAVLATKPISNYKRSPDMGESVEFSIDFATPLEKFEVLKDEIQKYIEKNPKDWHPNHDVVLKETENENRLKLTLYCNHTINFQKLGEKNKRRTKLVIEMKKMFEQLNIKFNLMPQSSSQP